MLDAAMQAQLKTYLGNLREGIELVASLDDSEKSRQTRALIEQIAGLHDLVTARFDGTDARKPSFAIRRASDANKWVRFAGLPMGHEFTSLVLALLQTGGHPPKVDTAVIEQIRALTGTLRFETQDADHRVVVEAHEGAVARTHAGRHPPQSEEPENVIDAQAAGVTQDRAQKIAIRQVAGVGEGIGSPRRLRPVLTHLVVHIRRSAD